MGVVGNQNHTWHVAEEKHAMSLQNLGTSVEFLTPYYFHKFLSINGHCFLRDVIVNLSQ